MKYKVGYFHNPGRDERGNESITHTVIIGIEEGEADRLPSKASIWRKYKGRLIDGTVWEMKENKKGKAGPKFRMKQRLVKVSDLFITPYMESRYSLYQRTSVPTT